MSPPSSTGSPGSREDELLDLPLSAVRSFELSPCSSDSESGTDSEVCSPGKENYGQEQGQNAEVRSPRKKQKKEKKHKKKDKRHKRKPRLIRNNTKGSSARRGHKDGSSIPHKKDGMKQKVLNAVAEYIDDHGDNWTASLMREEISEKYGWENNGDFIGKVKVALKSLGMSELGGNRLAAL